MGAVESSSRASDVCVTDRLRTPDRMCARFGSDGRCEAVDDNERDRWLSGGEITTVMNQLAKLTPRDDVRFLGVYALDVQRCAECKCSVRPNMHVEARRLLVHTPDPTSRCEGIVVNMSNHDGDGSHWVVLSIEPAEKRALYYDSSAKPAPDEIVRLVDRIGRNAGTTFELLENGHPHQTTGGECGMFCCNFLLSRYMGCDFERFCEQPWTHADMVYFRILVFGPAWIRQYQKEFGRRTIPSALLDTLGRYRLVFRNTDVDIEGVLYTSLIERPKRSRKRAIRSPSILSAGRS